jgi:hypothetical protein
MNQCDKLLCKKIARHNNGSYPGPRGRGPSITALSAPLAALAGFSSTQNPDARTILITGQRRFDGALQSWEKLLNVAVK